MAAKRPSSLTKRSYDPDDLSEQDYSADASPMPYVPMGHFTSSTQSSPFEYPMTSSTTASPYTHLLNAMDGSSPMAHVQNSLMQYNMHSNYASPNIHMPPSTNTTSPYAHLLQNFDGASPMAHVQNALSQYNMHSNYSSPNIYMPPSNGAQQPSLPTTRSRETWGTLFTGSQTTSTGPINRKPGGLQMTLPELLHKAPRNRIWTNVRDKLYQLSTDRGASNGGNFVHRAFLNKCGYDVCMPPQSSIILKIWASTAPHQSHWEAKAWCVKCEITDATYDVDLNLSAYDEDHFFEETAEDHHMTSIIAATAEWPIFVQTHDAYEGLQPPGSGESTLFAIPFEKIETTRSLGKLREHHRLPHSLDYWRFPETSEAEVLVTPLQPTLYSYSSLINGWFKCTIHNVTSFAKRTSLSGLEVEHFQGPNYVNFIYLDTLGLRHIGKLVSGKRLLLKIIFDFPATKIFYLECQAAPINTKTHVPPHWTTNHSDSYPVSLVLNDISDQYLFSADDSSHPLAKAAAESTAWPMFIDHVEVPEQGTPEAQAYEAPTSGPPEPIFGDNAVYSPGNEDFQLYDDN